VRYIAFNNLLKNPYDRGDSIMFINEKMSYLLLYKSPMIRRGVRSDGKCYYLVTIVKDYSGKLVFDLRIMSKNET
jgi:hypothetical protein